MKRLRWRAVAVPVVAAAVMVSGCGNGDGEVSAGSDDPSPAPTSSPTPPGPPPPTASWQPQPPGRPVETGWVRREYAATLDAAVASAGDALSWPGQAQVSAERFSGVCVVKLQRVGSGAFSPDVPALQQALATAVSAQGFADLAVMNDPGGALTFVAQDSRDALFEFRSKSETTVAVRVVTTDSECDT
ncbi:hypothetical protein [Nocardioides sp. LHG3406-4]|uniref:hypothetical protein n=1 Tax=Nocardioides sp. LHG3406-4 TaxID=2804575 RepID=UPI003CE97B18